MPLGRPTDVTVRGRRFRAWPSPAAPTFRNDVNDSHREVGAFAILNRKLGKESTCVDCGAGIGPTVLFAADTDAEATAFECDPVAPQDLGANRVLNPRLAGRVRVVEAAVPDHDEPLAIHAINFGNSRTTLFEAVERGGDSLHHGSMTEMQEWMPATWSKTRGGWTTRAR